ncbi:zinc-binding dehydrogenase [Vagococcus fluvialis]|uniref:Alcohol dehydrogenase catalytic domain-containing protein n=1 Tax=Vagococcus fluvialis TaxID=2738 RepID=A0A7X6I4M1_9ENTE|nr:zinc-binding dehydrogenase [Vagococcus fluvialis]MBO0486637.1 zinc-binding dehydrogenase [Vagococcus fluvialis]NKC58882.1 alcohol dehydrogenase catalytic domain-containing protein [Vagococcus fluvialis]NKC69324.1 alcohol dehydrogenase catalytic domain-containing protein [Vagococcus fluvialis]NKD49636.1 alcohol dehydrogenase catalytic domain-containing protein [Vagococcus fluvialis]
MDNMEMKGVCKAKNGYDQMELIDLEVPKATGDKIVIEVAYTGICGSDIHTFKGEYGNPTTPVILGHEFSGKVIDIGDKVTSVKVGDRVTSETTFSVCGICEYCKNKNYNLCPNRKGLGTQQNGSMANFVLAREESIHLLPDTLSYEGAAMSEPLACCVHAMYQKSRLELKDTILIIGPGPIGLYLLQIAKEIGSTVIMSGITQDTHRLKLAKELGADYVIDTQKNSLKELIDIVTNGSGVDKVYDASGSIHAINDCIPHIKKKGELIQVGLFKDKFNSIDLESIIQREIIYVGSRSQNPEDWPIAIHLLDKGAIEVNKMITKVFDLNSWREAFESVMSGEEIKVMIKSNEL